jgi:beta-lactam-binding protein with PASTA domain
MLYTDPQEPLTVEDLIFVPDVRGLSMVEAARLLRQRELEMAIEGSGIAVSQAPAPGEYVPREQVVTVNFQMPNEW